MAAAFCVRVVDAAFKTHAFDSLSTTTTTTSTCRSLGQLFSSASAVRRASGSLINPIVIVRSVAVGVELVRR